MQYGRGPGQRAGFFAACNRFPRQELAIRKLMKESEAFREMCEELAEAEAALARVDLTAPAAQRDVRRAQWAELVEVLAREVGQTLKQAVQ